MHIEISLVQNFSSNLQFFIFWTKFAQKGISGQNLKKLTSSLNSVYSNKSLGAKFLSKGVFPVKNKKNEHHHGILHILISLGTKFQLKLIVLSFWTKFTEKRYFQLKTEPAFQGLKPFCFLCSKR